MYARRIKTIILNTTKKTHTFILIRSRNWIQQLAMEAPVLRSISEGAEPRLRLASNFLHSEVTGISRPIDS